MSLKAWSDKFKDSLKDPMSNLMLWLLFGIPTAGLILGIAYLKLHPRFVSKAVAPNVTSVDMRRMAQDLEPPNPAEGLHVIAYTPTDTISTQTDSIKLLFDHSMVPMTDVDPDKHPTIPMTINPNVAGDFVWYGTKGFAYRFKENLPPATSFEVTLPGSLAALDKKNLGKDFKWNFYTPGPEVSTLAPKAKQEFVPPKTAIKISFSQAMQRKAVEENFKCLAWKTETPPVDPANPNAKPPEPNKEDCGLKFQFHWETSKKGEDILTATPDKPYPEASNLEIDLPKDLKPLRGDRGTTAGVYLNFSTAGAMTLQEINIVHPYPATENPEDTILYQNSEEENETEPAKKKPKKVETLSHKFPTGDICFNFSNPVDRASFESSLQFVPMGQTKPDPSFRTSIYYEDQVTPNDEEMEAAQNPADLPHRTACLSADLKYQSAYEIRFTKPILDRAGQTLSMKSIPLPLRFETMHAGLEASLDITKNVFNANKLPLVPYTSINAERVDIRLIPCSLNSTTLSGTTGACIEAHDGEEKSEGDSEADAAQGQEATPQPEKVDPLLRKVPIEAEYDLYHHGKIDLTPLYPNVKPGLYEIEAVFQPMSEITLKKKIKKQGIEQDVQVPTEPVTVKKRIQLAETALALKKFENQFMVWTVDIGTGEPRPGLNVQVWKQESLLATGWTNEEGIFNFVNNTIDPTNDKITVIADDPLGFGMMTSEDDEGIKPDDFGVAYERPRYVKNYFAFLHSDRPLYRPNQTVYFSGFLRDLREGVYHLPHDISSLKVTITDSDGTSIYNKDLPVSATGAFGDQWNLGDDSIPRGRYQITATIPTLNWTGEEAKQTFTQAFYVASYKKPDFKVSLTPDKRDVVSGDPLNIVAKGSYFFGAPLANAQIEWSIREDGFRFAPDKFQDYLFVDEEAIQKALKRVQEGTATSYEEREEFANDGEEVSAGVYSTDSDSRMEDPKLNPDKFQGPPTLGMKTEVIPAEQTGLGPDGLFTIHTTPNLAGLPTSQIFTATLTAKEWGQEVSAVTDVRIHQSSVYVGLKPERQVYAKGQHFSVDLVTLNPEAEAVPNQIVALKLFKRDYMSVKKRNEDGSWVFESEPKDSLVQETSLTTDLKGHANFSAPAEQGGTYRLVATTKDAQARSQSAAVHIDVGGDSEAAFKLGADNRLEMVPDKKRYQAGDTAQLLVPISTAGMRGLLTIERAGILMHQLIQFGPNQNMISVPIKEDYIPNVYASLLLFRPQDKESAMMKVGLTEIKVEPEKKRLSLELKPDKPSYAPKDKVHLSIHTTDSSGKGTPADLIVSVADESVLRLIDYQSPDLLKRFYFNRKLGVLTSENMIHYKSGDAPQAEIEKKKRAKFLDTAFFTSSVRTDANGMAEVEFEMPDNITTWVAEGFAVSEDTKVGSNFTTFVSSLPVFLRPALPRFLAVEDVSEPLVYVENPGKEKYEGNIQIQVSGDAQLSTPSEQAVTIEPESRAPIFFGLNGVHAGRAKLNFMTSRSAQKEVMDVLELALPIEDHSVPMIYSAGGATRAEAVEQVKVPAGARTDRGELTLTVGSSPMKILLEAMKYLLEFPYGCGEQRMSALLGLWQLLDISHALQATGAAQLPEAFQKVYAEHYHSGDKTVDNALLKKSLEEGLAALYEFQNGDGGFSFWKEEGVSDPMLSSAMARAFRVWLNSGIDVDLSAQARLGTYLQSLLNRQKQLPAPPPGKPDVRQYEADSRAELAWGLVATDITPNSSQKVVQATPDPFSPTPALNSILEMKDVLGPRGLSSLILAIQGMGKQFDQGSLKGLAKQLRKQVKENKTPQGTQTYWEDPNKVWDPVQSTAVALQALLAMDPKDELAESSAGYLISQAKQGNFGNTQSTRESLLALSKYSEAQEKNKETIPATLTVGKDQKTDNLPAASLSHWLEEVFPIAGLPQNDQPLDIKVAKPEKVRGALYYQANLRAYFPIDLVPRREDGLIISREFYEIDDVKEEHPLKEFKIGKSYKVTLTVMVSRTLSQLTVEDLLPAGFDPVDFSLATSNQELADKLEEAERTSPAFTPSEFEHQEIHDDRVMWSGSRVYPGIYTLRHVVLASTVGEFQAPGATVFPFYDDRDYFGRSRSMLVKVTKEK